MTVSGAYGRDYKSAKAMKADWNAGRDFIVRDLFSGDDGRPVNKPQVPGVPVMGRYKAGRSVARLQ